MDNLWQLFIDGAARNNPGPAGAGIYLIKQGEPCLKQGFFLGTKTNNQAEYLALMLGLCQVRLLYVPGDTLHIFSDSELLVRQLQGRYAVKNKELQQLHTKVVQLLEGLSYDIHHILRAGNVIADKLANEGIDQKKEVPEQLKQLCNM